MVVPQVGQVVGEVGEVVADAGLQVLADVTIDRGQRAAAARRSRYRRMTFSEGVRASMKPWRLKMRSAYFMSGTAVFGSSMP